MIFDAFGTSDIDDPAENLSYRWEFGDGATADGMNASHKFRAPGNYLVTLTVEDGSGGSVSRSLMVNIPAGAAEQTGWMLPAAVAAAIACGSVAAIVLVWKKNKGRKGAIRRRAQSGQTARPKKA